MSWLAWIIVGLLAGGLARMATRSKKRGCVGTMVIGVLGGLLGGMLFNLAGDEGINDFTLRSTFVAFIGACVLLLGMQALGLNQRRR